MRRILCLHLPQLATQRVQRDDINGPADAARPLVLTERLGGKLIVAQRCPRAAAGGVRVGQTLGEAQATVPDLLALPYEPQRDARTLRRLARWADRFSPTVEPCPPNVLLLDVTGCQRLFGGEEALAQQAVAGVGEQGFAARAAVADTVGAAYALATHGEDDIVIAAVEQSSVRLAGLPVAALRLSAETLDGLAALGVRTIGDVLHLPRSSLAGRFGPELVGRLQQTLGEAPEPLAAYRPTAAPVARLRFEEPVGEAGQIVPLLERMLETVAEQVERRELGVRRLDVVVYWRGRPPTVVRVRLSRASRAWPHIGQMLQGRVERVDFSPGALGLMLVAAETSRWQPEQGRLFEPSKPGHKEALGAMVDRLASRLGEDAVTCVQLTEDHQPEFAFRYEPARHAEQVVRPPPATETAASQPLEPMPRAEAALAGLRPTRLFERPMLVRAIALAPDGPPTWFAWRDAEYLVARAWGPERVATAWWRGGDVRRDYFRVLTEGGEQYWLFRHDEDRRWYLHGVFA